MLEILEKINPYLTVISIIVTVISVISTVVSIIYSLRAKSEADKAKQYKEDTLLLLDTFSLGQLVIKFDIESRSFLEKTRVSQWYKGVDPNLIISPFKGVLSSFGSIYHLVDNSEVLQGKVHRLNESVQTYNEANSGERRQVNTLILDITEILHQEIVRNRDKVTISA